MTDNKNHKIEVSEEEIIERIEKEGDEATPKTIDNVILHEDDIEKKSKRLNKDKFGKLYKQVRLALQMIRDFKAKRYTMVPWRTMALISVGILYFLNPMDIMPDIIPILGLTDDAIALAAIFKSIQSDLKLYCEWRGLDLDEYF
ncbi:MAG TPA: YkvA family protein [Ignavibacteria bacterium]|nr:YkvA family protein [Ignavibacteria bacterium]